MAQPRGNGFNPRESSRCGWWAWSIRWRERPFLQAPGEAGSAREALGERPRCWAVTGMLRAALSVSRSSSVLAQTQPCAQAYTWSLGEPLWQTSSGLLSGWVTAPSPTASPRQQPQPHRSVRLLPVMFWRSQTGIVYKEPAESCNDSPVRCDGVVDCSQRSDELGCGEGLGAGVVGARGPGGVGCH